MRPDYITPWLAKHVRMHGDGIRSVGQPLVHAGRWGNYFSLVNNSRARRVTGNTGG